MADASKIEWTDATWNPVTGCTKVSPGCANCYIERTPPFRMASRYFQRPIVGYDEVTRVAQFGSEMTTGVRLHPDRLDQPLRWRKPRRIFVCSLADLFHDDVPDEYIRDVFNAMRRCDGSVTAATGKAAPSHTFQVLTKRPERALAMSRDRRLGFGLDEWRTKAANVWLGVSIENARYTWRADVLREIPAAVRFISAEPLLGSLFDLGSARTGAQPGSADGDFAVTGFPTDRARKHLDLSGIDWVIAGGESGPGARPMHPDWAREIRDACLDAPLSSHACDRCEVDHPWRECDDRPRPAFFFKQWGEWVAEDQSPEDATMPGEGKCPWGFDDVTVYRLGKNAAGRLLDDRKWNEMPGGAT